MSIGVPFLSVGVRGACVSCLGAGPGVVALQKGGGSVAGEGRVGLCTVCGVFGGCRSTGVCCIGLCVEAGWVARRGGGAWGLGESRVWGVAVGVVGQV